MTPAVATPTTLHAARRMLAEAGPRPRRRLLHLLVAARRCCRCSRSTTALLWYPSHYEGFESSDNVVYTGAAPNQHIVPLAEHLLRHYGTQRLLPRLELHLGLGEQQDHARGGPVGRRRRSWPSATSRSARPTSTRLIRQILDCRPNFIFNTLIGDSAYAFFRAFRARRQRAGDRPAARHAGGELQPGRARTGRDRRRGRAGHLSSCVYFESIDTPANRAFVPAYRRRFPDAGPDLGRCRGLLPRGPSARPRRPARRHRRRWPRSGRPCPTSPSTRRRAGCGSIATTATATSRRASASRPTACGFDVIYEAPAPGEARPLPRLAGRAGGVAHRGAGRAFAW